MEQWEEVAVEKGFSPEQAQLMVRQTFAGSVALLEHSKLEPAELRRQVTSPGGTTERIITTLDEAGLKQTFEESLEAAVARAKELAG